MSRTEKNWSSAGAWNTMWETKPTAPSSRAISSVAKPMKETMSPTVALPCRCSTVPSMKMQITVMVAAARVSTATTAHQFSTGNCRSSTWPTISWNSRASDCRREKDCTTITLESASCALPASCVCSCSTWPCATWVLRITQVETIANSTTSTISSRPSRQFRNRVSGSSTRAPMKVIRCSRKKDSQRPNRLSDPSSMIFISRPDCVSPWKDSGSASTCWK